MFSYATDGYQIYRDGGQQDVFVDKYAPNNKQTGKPKKICQVILVHKSVKKIFQVFVQSEMFYYPCNRMWNIWI